MNMAILTAILQLIGWNRTPDLTVKGIDNTRLLQSCYIMTVPVLLEQLCNKSDNINKVVTDC